MKEPEIIDLEPHQWKSEREKPHEPIFAAGWPIGLGVFVAIISATLLIHSGWLDRTLAGGLGGIIGSIAGMIAAQITADR